MSTKVSTEIGSVHTVGDLVTNVDAVLALVRSKAMTESEARLHLTGCKVQLNAASLQIQYSRLHRGKNHSVMPIMVPSEPESVSALTAEEAEQLKRLQEKAQAG